MASQGERDMYERLRNPPRLRLGHSERRRLFLFDDTTGMAADGERRMNERLSMVPKVGVRCDGEESEEEFEAVGANRGIRGIEAGSISGLVNRCEGLTLAGGIKGGGFKIQAAVGGRGGREANGLDLIGWNWGGSWWLGFNLGGSDAGVWKLDDAGLRFGVALGEGGAGWKLEEEIGVWEVGWRCRWKCRRGRGPLVMVTGGDGGGSGGPLGPLD